MGRPLRSLRSPHPALRASAGCIVSYCPIASALGSQALATGGNCIDAAVATAFGLAVTYPQAGNIGGGGFLIAHLPERGDHALDYRETAPRKLTMEHLVDGHGLIGDRNVFGAYAVGVPGTVAGLGEAHRRFGRLGWDRLVAPAIALAERGVWLTSRQASYLELYHAELSRAESTRRQFTGGDRPLLPGTLFVQEALGRTLRRIAEQGPDEFYRGETARLIASEIARSGGVLDEEDLAGYRPVWRAPATLDALSHRLLCPPLPSAGSRVLRLSLALVESLGVRALPAGSVERLAWLARIFRWAYSQRRATAGDPDHLPPELLAEDLAAPRLDRARFEARERELAAPQPRSLSAGADNTTHFCVLDSEGGAVSNTYSLNILFGSKLTVSGAGFLLNSSVDDFSLGHANWYDLDDGDHNRIAPGRRAASSMTPSLLLRDGKVAMVVGASGGPRIPTVLTQVMLSVLGDGTAIDDAVREPRLHHQLRPDLTCVERRMPEPIAEALSRRGRVERVPNLGIVAGIRLGEDGELQAALDGRFMLE